MATTNSDEIRQTILAAADPQAADSAQWDNRKTRVLKMTLTASRSDVTCGADEAEPPAIRARALSKSYHSAGAEPVLALRRLDFDIRRGEFISIIGQSGCGKSTLLRTMAGLLPYSSGSLKIDGEPVQGPSRACAVVFQSPVLLPWRTVLENVLLPIEFKRLPVRTYRDRALATLTLVGLQDFTARYPYELSGGMQQRVAIARALVQEPGLMLMDEPFGALDAMTREQMNLELLRIWHHTRNTVVFVTHSVSEAIFLSDRVIALTARPGEIAEIVDIDLPRPRDLSVINTGAFGRYAERLRTHLRATGAMF
jgi:NitT/TauT family transport system ATP-binding protein